MTFGELAYIILGILCVAGIVGGALVAIWTSAAISAAGALALTGVIAGILGILILGIEET